MKKFLGFIFFFLFSTITVFSADMRFIQVDCALFNIKDKNSISSLENIVEDINKQKDVEFVVFSGNNISKPTKENLEGFTKITKRLNYPYYFILGNKDINKQKDFGKNEYFSYLKKHVKTHKKINSPNYVFVKNKIAFIVVDGSKEVIPTPQGYFKEQTLDWLEEQLIKYNENHVIILQHFPIVPPAKKEIYYTFKADEYLELINNHKNIKAVVSGHFNVNNEQKVGDILHISTPNAPQYKIVDILDYENQNPTFWNILK